MLESIEIKNFENHEHTVINDLSKEFNLICGPSNVGKTSIVRALAVVAYNAFNLGSVRLGAKYCEITVKTDKGTVRARRGKGINEWDVTQLNGKKEHYQSIGKNVLDEVSAIIGLRVIKLGENNIKVNMMDQLESHFLLAEVDGENASGSLRAQIIDEISGITGIETLIRDVALDNTRFARDVKKFEDENARLVLQLHNEKEIEQEENLLAEIDAIFVAINQNKQTIQELTKLSESHTKTQQEIKAINDKLSKLLDQKQLVSISAIVKACETNCKTYDNLVTYSNDFEKTEQTIQDATNKLKKLIDVAPIEKITSSCEKEIRKLGELCTIKSDYADTQQAIVKCEGKINKLPRTKMTEGKIETIVTQIDSLQELAGLLESHTTTTATIAVSTKKLTLFAEQQAKYEQEEKDILTGFEVCPICKQAIPQEQVA